MNKYGLSLASIALLAVLSQGASAADAEITLKAGAASSAPTDKRQHKPVVPTKPVDKASPKSTSQKKPRPAPHKVGDITLKRGVMGTTPAGTKPAAKKKGGKVEASWKVEEGK